MVFIHWYEVYKWFSWFSLFSWCWIVVWWWLEHWSAVRGVSRAISLVVVLVYSKWVPVSSRCRREVSAVGSRVMMHGQIQMLADTCWGHIIANALACLGYICQMAWHHCILVKEFLRAKLPMVLDCSSSYSFLLSMQLEGNNLSRQLFQWKNYTAVINIASKQTFAVLVKRLIFYSEKWLVFEDFLLFIKIQMNQPGISWTPLDSLAGLVLSEFVNTGHFNLKMARMTYKF